MSEQAVVFKRTKLNANGSAEYRQEGSTISFRCSEAMFNGEAPAEIRVICPTLAPPDPKRLEREKAKEEREAKRAEKQQARDAKKAAREQAREAKKAAREQALADKKAKIEEARKKKAAEKQSAGATQ